MSSTRPTVTRVGRLATRSDVRKAGRSPNRAARARLPRRLFRHPAAFWYNCLDVPRLLNCQTGWQRTLTQLGEYVELDRVRGATV